MNENYQNIEGIHACLEAIEHNVPIIEIMVGNYINIKNNHSVEQIIKTAQSQNIKVKKIDKSILDNNSQRGAHQGVIAKIEAFKYKDIKQIIDNTHNKTKSLIIILDHINDSGNLGAIARSAEAFGADGIVITNKRCCKVTATTYKTSAGAICKIPVAMVANINSTIQLLKDNDFWVASATEHAQKNIWEENLKGKLALVMGSEHEGVSKLIQKNSDYLVKIPIIGEIESLNVAQASTACMYEWLRQNS